MSHGSPTSTQSVTASATWPRGYPLLSSPASSSSVVAPCPSHFLCIKSIAIAISPSSAFCSSLQSPQIQFAPPSCHTMAAIAGFTPLVGASLATSRASCCSALAEPSSSARLWSHQRSSTATTLQRRATTVVCSNSSSTGDSVSVETEPSAGTSPSGTGNWVPVIPLSALPRGERRLVRQDGETVLLLWYKNDVYAIENQSPAEGAYSEGLINARLTPEGCIICPSTESTYDLKTGKMVEWMPTNPILRVLTPSLRDLVSYPVKVEDDSIYINVQGKGDLAEIVFGGASTGQAGKTATNIDVDEVRMEVDDTSEGFGWTRKNEIINGRAAMAGFFMLIIQELVTGKGFLKGLGFLDFLYKVTGYSP